MMIERPEGKALQATRVPEGCVLVMFDGAVRSSKTISSLLMWLKFIREGPEGMLAIVGRTETSAINNVVTPLQEMLGIKRVVLNRGTGTVEILGRRVHLYGANDAQAYTKIQGATLAGAYVDEGAVIAQSFFNMLRSRLSVAGAMLYLTCNPEGPKHWLKVEWLDKAEWHLDRHGELHHHEEWDDDGAPLHLPIWRVTFLLDDNAPLLRHNPTFVEHLKRSWPVGSVFYRRYILSEWVNAEGAIYDMWNDAAMTIPRDLIPHPERVLGVGLDYGTTHPTRAYLTGLVTARLGANGKPDWEATKYGWPAPGGTRKVLVTLAEFAPPRATVGEHARLFELWLAEQAHFGKPEWIAIDPAAATFKMEMHVRGRRDTMNAHNRVVPGIQLVQSLLYAAHLYVAETCPELRNEIPGYMWSTKATEKGKTEPVKENDDAVDAWRYSIMSFRRMWLRYIDLPTPPDDSEDDG
nr:MAG: terminase large subunit [Caudoviricetes sp.]